MFLGFPFALWVRAEPFCSAFNRKGGLTVKMAAA
jgi:hypothetical protein